jgi:hypothetical protein
VSALATYLRNAEVKLRAGCVGIANSERTAKCPTRSTSRSLSIKYALPIPILRPFLKRFFQCPLRLQEHISRMLIPDELELIRRARQAMSGRRYPLASMKTDSPLV